MTFKALFKSRMFKVGISRKLPTGLRNMGGLFVAMSKASATGATIKNQDTM